MWQFLYFLPLPHGHGSLRPTFSVRLRIGSFFFSDAALVDVASPSAAEALLLAACRAPEASARQLLGGRGAKSRLERPHPLMTG